MTYRIVQPKPKHASPLTTPHHTSPRLAAQARLAAATLSGRAPPEPEEVVRAGVAAELAIREQTPRPVLPHGYVPFVPHAFWVWGHLATLRYTQQQCGVIHAVQTVHPGVRYPLPKPDPQATVKP